MCLVYMYWCGCVLWVCAWDWHMCVLVWLCVLYVSVCGVSELFIACKALGLEHSKFSINVSHYESLELLGFFFHLIFFIKV